MSIIDDAVSRPDESRGGANEAEQTNAEESTQAAPHDRLILKSSDLLQSRREIWIEHGDDLYRLRVTNNGKLLLTK